MTLNDINTQLAAVNKQVTLFADTSNQQIAAVVKAVSDVTAALRAYADQQQPSPPPPVPVKPVRFGRFLHEQDTRFLISEQAERYEVQVLQGDEWHEVQRAALRTFPGTTTLRAATPVARRPGDTPGDSTCLPPGRIPDAWMLRDTAGHIIGRERDEDQFVDPGNAAYQQAVKDYLPKRLKAEGWDGVWIDEINPDPRASFFNNNHLPAGVSSPYRYQVAIRQFVNAVTPAFHTAGLKVWINLAGDYDDAWTNGLARETDGHAIEFFVARYPHETGSLTNGYFGEALGWMTRREAEGKPAIYNAQATDPDVVRYALVVFLLATQGRGGVFGAGRDPYPVAETVWTPDMVAATKLGRPLGEYKVVDGLYVRDFEHGGVAANPSSVTVAGLAPLSGAITLAT